MDKMSSAEFNRWAKFLSEEPDIGTRLDVMLARIADLLKLLIYATAKNDRLTLPETGWRLVDWDGKDKAREIERKNREFIEFFGGVKHGPSPINY